jgi:hypothetical protein
MSDLFTRYRISIRMANKIMGGTPKDPKVIEGWIRTRMGLDQGDQLRLMVVKTMREIGHDIGDDPTPAQLDEAIKATVGDKSTNGFKRDERGLYIEGRQIKAALKENTAILFPYVTDKWGATKKAPKAYLAERVFCEEDTIPLGRQEPDGVDCFIGHVTGPQGPRSTLTYVEYCERPELAFTVWSLEDSVKREDWEAIFELMEQNGIGALRSQGHGRFALTNVEVLPAKSRPKFFSWEKPKLAVVDAAD